MPFRCRVLLQKKRASNIWIPRREEEREEVGWGKGRVKVVHIVL